MGSAIEPRQSHENPCEPAWNLAWEPAGTRAWLITHKPAWKPGNPRVDPRTSPWETRVEPRLGTRNHWGPETRGNPRARRRVNPACEAMENCRPEPGSPRVGTRVETRGIRGKPCVGIRGKPRVRARGKPCAKTCCILSCLSTVDHLMYVLDWMRPPAPACGPAPYFVVPL